MLKKLTNNIGLKLISLVAAIVVWLVVVNVDDPVSYRTYYDIPVNIINDSIVINEGKVYEVLESSNIINVTVKAKRSILDDLSSGDFSATANMQEMDINLGLVPIDISINKYSNKIEELTSRTKNLKIDIQDYTSLQFPVSAQVEGNAKEGYVVDDIAITPNVLKISGAASAIAKIDKVVVYVDIDGMGTNMNLKLSPVLLDVSGSQLQIKEYQCNYDLLDVTVTMIETKKVKIRLEGSESSSPGNKKATIECNPDSVLVVGAKEDLEKMDEIVIPSSEFDTSNLNESTQTTIDITKYLPEGVSLAENQEKNILVNVIIEKLVERQLHIPSSRLKMSNLTIGLSADVNDEEFVISVIGEADKVEKLTESGITMELDFEKYIEPGNYKLPVKVVVPTGISVTNAIEASVIIAKLE